MLNLREGELSRREAVEAEMVGLMGAEARSMLLHCAHDASGELVALVQAVNKVRFAPPHPAPSRAPPRRRRVCNKKVSCISGPPADRRGDVGAVFGRWGRFRPSAF